MRKYWRTVNRDESNPNVVFRAREKQKIETRRHKRGNTIENLDKVMIIERIRLLTCVIIDERAETRARNGQDSAR
mgnify:CR=1 FL=1